MSSSGLVASCAQVSTLIKELNELLASGEAGGSSGGSSGDLAGGISPDAVSARLSPANRAVFDLLPAAIQGDLLRERDPHGNVQVGPGKTSDQPHAFQQGFCHPSTFLDHTCLHAQSQDRQCHRLSYAGMKRGCRP